MRRIGDRQFLLAWQIVRAATQPDPEATVWSIGDVLCRRYRHSVMTPDHGIVLDVCHLERNARKGGWHLMVTAENWWDNRRAVLRAQLWASHVAGSKEDARVWMLREAASLESHTGASR